MKIDFSSDPLINAVYQGIKRGIQVTYDNQCVGSCVILIYCGMDAMTFLSMPANQSDARGQDFVVWAAQYVIPHLKYGTNEITGEELYSARCAMVHTYTMESAKTRQGVRVMGYQFDGGLPIVSDSSAILIRVDYLREAFYSGINKFLMEEFADSGKRPILETRLRKLMNTIPYGRSILTEQ